MDWNTHAARRKKQEESEYNTATLLLELLRQLQLKGRARSFLLLSATPMQTQPWEPWDLLAVLGEGGTWLADFATVRTFYRALIAVQNGRCTEETAQQVAATIASDPGFPPSSDLPVGASEAAIAQALAFPLLTQQNSLAAWLRHGSPLTRRMHRNTRQTLRDYYARGLLNQPPPTRRVRDVLFDFQDSAERTAYNAISHYIDRRFRELENERAGKGFVMTIYRRRAASSPYAFNKACCVVGRVWNGLLSSGRMTAMKLMTWTVAISMIWVISTYKVTSAQPCRNPRLPHGGS